MTLLLLSPNSLRDSGRSLRLEISPQDGARVAEAGPVGSRAWALELEHNPMPDRQTLQFNLRLPSFPTSPLPLTHLHGATSLPLEVSAP
jgi:hypothetical protein